MLVLNLHSQFHFCGCLVCILVKSSSYRHATGNESFPRHPTPDKLVHERDIRNKIVVQVGLFHTGTAGIIGRDKACDQWHGMMLQHGAQRQCGKHMGADNPVIPAIQNKMIQLFRTGGKIAVNSSAFPENRSALFCAVITGFVQLRRIAVNAAMPAGDETGCSF